MLLDDNKTCNNLTGNDSNINSPTLLKIQIPFSVIENLVVHHKIFLAVVNFKSLYMSVRRVSSCSCDRSILFLSERVSHKFL